METCKSYIECQFWKPGTSEGSENRPFVTISRQAGAGALVIGKKLNAFLREHDKDIRCGCPWTVFDKEMIQRALDEHDLPQHFSKYLSEEKTSEIDDLMEELFGLHPARWVMVRKVSETILHLAVMGHVILIGRGANVVTRQLPAGFHVRLVGSFEKRRDHLCDYYRITKKQAEEMMAKEDAGRKNYLKKYFNSDIESPLLYDLVLNTDTVSYDEAARVIGQAVLQRSEALAHG